MLTFGFGVVIGGALAFIKKDQAVKYQDHFIYQLKILKITVPLLILVLAIILLPTLIFWKSNKEIADFFILPGGLLILIPFLIYFGMCLKGITKVLRNK